MKRELSSAELKKIGVALSLFLALSVTSLAVWRRAQAGQQEAATHRQMSLEMGHQSTEVLTSRPEEEPQKSDPYFRP